MAGYNFSEHNLKKINKNSITNKIDTKIRDIFQKVTIFKSAYV